MKNFLITMLIFLIVTSLVFGVLHVTGMFIIKDYLLQKAKENPELAKWLQTKEEVTAMSNELTDLNNTITTKDQSIAEFQREIEKLQRVVANRDQEITGLKDQIDELQTKLTDHTIRIKEMAGIYNEMERDKAAEILQGLDDELIVQILKTLKKDAAAEILAFFSADRAAGITKAYTLWEKN